MAKVHSPGSDGEEPGIVNPVVGGADDGVRATEVIASFDSGRPNPIATLRGEIAAELGVKESSAMTFGDDGMLLP